MSRFWNLAGLALGHLLGHGSFLMASFVILGREQYELAAAVGVAVTIMTLSMLVVDMGGQWLLARDVALKVGELTSNVVPKQQSALSMLIMLRFLAWLFLIILFYTLEKTNLFISNQILQSFLNIAPLGLFFWVFNQTGILDGRQKQGLSGLINSIPWILISLSMVILHPNESSLKDIGNFLCISFTVGILICVVIQGIILRSSPFLALNFKAFKNCLPIARVATNILLSQLPGQLTGRVQIFFAIATFPVDVAAAFILSRNILSSSNNLLNLVRRVEFPMLVQLMECCQPSLIKIVSVQRISFITLAILSVVYIIFGFVAVNEFLPVLLKGSEMALVITLGYLPVLVASALSGALVQALLAHGRPAALIKSSIMSFLVSTFLTWTLIKHMGILAMIFASFAANLLVIVIVALVLLQNRRCIT